LSFLMLALLFSEVRPFGRIAAENVAVEIVTPEQVPTPDTPPTPKPQTSDAFDLSSKSAAEGSPQGSAQATASSSSAAEPAAASQPTAAQPTAPQPAAAQPQPQAQAATEQAALPVPSPKPVPAAAPAPDRPPPAAQPQASAPAPSPQPAYAQPQPDLSVKYHVRLGLPQGAPGDAFKGPATENADLEASSIGQFRRHLKSCSILPKSIAPSDDLAIKLRIVLTRDGRLAAEPLLIEAKASAKGPLLTQAAIGALQSCQPYSMLPADKYDEWKMLDISFTPRDFGGS
jgi:hypothetical protein